MELFKSKRQQSADTMRRSGARERRESVLLADEAQSPLWQRLLILVGFSLILGVLVTPHYIVLPVNYQVGDVSDRDIKAAHDFLITAEAATQQKREEADRKSLAVYDLDEETVQNLRQRLETSFAMMRSLYQQPAESSGVGEGSGAKSAGAIHKSAQELALEKKEEFEKGLGITVSTTDYAILVKEKFDPRIEDAVVELAENVIAGGVVGNKSLLLSEMQKG